MECDVLQSTVNSSIRLGETYLRNSIPDSLYTINFEGGGGSYQRYRPPERTFIAEVNLAIYTAWFSLTNQVTAFENLNSFCGDFFFQICILANRVTFRFWRGQLISQRATEVCVNTDDSPFLLLEHSGPKMFVFHKFRTFYTKIVTTQMLQYKTVLVYNTNRWVQDNIKV